MEYQASPNSSLDLPCGLYQFMSITEGTALLCLVMGNTENSVCDNHNLKYHDYCKYHDTSILVLTVHTYSSEIMTITVKLQNF